MDALRFSKRLTLGLFIPGTILFILFAISLTEALIIPGLYYIALAFLIAGIYLCILLFKIVTGRIERITGIKSILILLLNIPFTLLYAYLTIALLDYARITFENKTGQNLTSIRILGCQEKEIAKLNADESTTVWIKIESDCRINIEYKINEKIRTKNVIGYLSPSLGVIKHYKIESRINNNWEAIALAKNALSPRMKYLKNASTKVKLVGTRYTVMFDSELPQEWLGADYLAIVVIDATTGEIIQMPHCGTQGAC